jgi:hypothetical protein
MSLFSSWCTHTNTIFPNNVNHRYKDITNHHDVWIKISFGDTSSVPTHTQSIKFHVQIICFQLTNNVFYSLNFMTWPSPIIMLMHVEPWNWSSTITIYIGTIKFSDIHLSSLNLRKFLFVLLFMPFIKLSIYLYLCVLIYK